MEFSASANATNAGTSGAEMEPSGRGETEVGGADVKAAGAGVKGESPVESLGDSGAPEDSLGETSGAGPCEGVR